MEEEREKLKFFSADALIGLLVKAGSDVDTIVTLNKEQLIELCLVAKGLKEGVLPKKGVKEVTMVEMMQMMMDREERQREIMMERDERHRKEQREIMMEQREIMMEREEQVKKEQRESRMEYEEQVRREQNEREERQREFICAQEEEIRKEQREWQTKLLDSQIHSQEKMREEAKRERDRKTREEEAMGTKIKKFGDILKNVLPKMPTEDVELPLYLESVESMFAIYQVPDDLKCALLMPFFSEKAKKLIRRLPVDQLTSYAKLKVALLREFRLTPQQYKGQFTKAEKLANESWMQFATRLRTYLRFYLESREVDNFQKIQDLWVADKMKECMPFVLRSHVIAKESDSWIEPIKLAELSDIFSINLSEGQNVKEIGFKFPPKFGEGRSFQNYQRDGKGVEKRPQFQKFNDNSLGRNKGQGTMKFEKPKCFICLSEHHFKANCPRNKTKVNPGVARVNQVEVEGEVKEAGVCLVKVEPDNTGEWYEGKGFCNSWEMEYGPYDYCRETEYCLEDKAIELQKVRRDKKGEEEVVVDLNSLFECSALNISAGNAVAVSSGVTLSSIPRVKLQIGKSACTALLDSGSEITVVNKRMLPNVGEGSQPLGKIKLRGAFGVPSEANLMNLPCMLVSDEGHSKVSVLLTCAVTDDLMLDTECLLTLDDYKALTQNDGFNGLEIEIDEGQTLEGGVDSKSLEDECNAVCVKNVLQVEGTSGGGTSAGEEDAEGLFTMDSSDGIEQRTEVSDILDETPLLVKAAEQLRKEQLADDGLKEWWEKGKNNEGGYSIRAVDGVLFHRDRVGGQSVQQLVVPRIKVREILDLAHDSVWGGHFGSRKTLQRIKLSFWWPGMSKEVKEYCQSCTGCQLRRRKTTNDRVPITPVVRTTNAFEVVNCDIIGPFEQVSRGFKYVLCVIDQCTKWPDVRPLRTINAEAICEALLEMFSYTGVPRVVVTDRAASFRGKLMKEFMKRLGCAPRFSSPYHPEGNAIVERWNQTLKNMLHQVVKARPKGWEKELPFLLWAYRELPNATTGVSPFMMVYGQIGRGPLTILKETWTGDQIAPWELANTSKYMQRLKKQMQLSKDLAEEHSKEAQKSYAHYYNLRSKDKTFEIGDQVVILEKDCSDKLSSRWIGPGVITRKISAYSYLVQMPDGGERTLHANFLRRFNPRVSAVGLICDGEEDFGRVDCQPVDVTETIDRTTIFDQIDFTHLDVDQQQDLRKLLQKFTSLFDDKPGLCKLGTHSIRLQGEVHPRRQKPYRIPQLFKGEVDRQITQLLADGLIEESNSPWAHPVVCVRKADGKSLRLCCDYRGLNSFSLSDCFPMCQTEDLINQVASAKYITTLDCSSGYWQVPMQEDSKELTAFVTHRGMYQWLRMPFGLKGASATYQRIANKILEPHSDYADAYIDDFAIHSESWKEHLKHLEDVLFSIQKSGLTLKLSKCVFGKAKVKWLGHLLGSGVKEVDQDKVSAIQNIPLPNTKKELRHFLGLCGYYRAFIPSYAEVALPLTELTKSRNMFCLDCPSKAYDAFIRLKEALMSSHVLIAPDFHDPFIVQTDASDYAVGVCLAQLRNGCERPIAYASRKLSETQQRWSTIEKESYAVIFALQRFEHYLIGAKMLIIIH